MSEPLQGLVVLPRLLVQNANCLSGPLTWGFPAITAFTGWDHALARHLGEAGQGLHGVGVVCHRFDPQIYQPNPYQRRFCLTRHPLSKDGKPPGTVEEGRANMVVTLLLGVNTYLDQHDGSELAQRIWQTALTMRLAGGSVFPIASPRIPKACFVELGDTLDSHRKEYKGLRWKLLPGFALRERSDLLARHLEKMQEESPGANAMDALLDLICLKAQPLPPEDALDEGPANDEPDEAQWRVFREEPGWLVPLPLGYGAISQLYEPGRVKNSRDRVTPFRFVEALYSLGEWVSPHRLQAPHEMLWHHRARPEEGLYLCRQMQSI